MICVRTTDVNSILHYKVAHIIDITACIQFACTCMYMHTHACTCIHMQTHVLNMN